MTSIGIPNNRIDRAVLLNFAILTLCGILAFAVENFAVLILSVISLLVINFFFSYLAPKDCIAPSRNIALVVYFIGVLYLMFFMLYYPTLYGIPYIKGGSDDLGTFEGGSQMLASMGHFTTVADVRAYVRTSHPGYNVLLANLIRVAEGIDSYHTTLPRLINILCTAVISGFTYILGIHIGLSKKIARLAAILFGIYPSVLFFSAVVVRSLIIAFLVALAVLGYLLTQSRNVRRILLGFILLFISLGTLYYFRSWQVPAMAAIILISYIFTKTNVNVFYRIFICICILVAAFTISRNIIEYSYSAVGGVIMGDKMLLNIPRPTHAERQDADLSRYVFNQPFPINLPIQVAYGLISPVPVFSTDLTRLHASFFSLLFTLCLPALFIGSKIAWKRSEIRWVSIVFWTIFIGVAISSCKGRQFLQVYPYGFLLIALGWQYAPKRVFYLTRFWGFAVAFLGVLYYFLKFL